MLKNFFYIDNTRSAIAVIGYDIAHRHLAPCRQLPE